MRFPSSVCAVALALAAGALAQSRPANTDRSSEVGMSFARHLSQGRYAEAAGMVDDSVKAQMSSDLLKAVWASISKGKGEFRKVGTPPPRPFQARSGWLTLGGSSPTRH